jgi:hypothetical protein
MPVLKHISPKFVPVFPMDVPLKMVPSASSSTAGNLVMVLLKVFYVLANVNYHQKLIK